MSKYIILKNNELNGKSKGVNIFYAAEIMSGEHKGKFAASVNALKEFPEIFESEEYEVSELDSSLFVMAEKDQLLKEKKEIEKRLNEIENERELLQIDFSRKIT